MNLKTLLALGMSAGICAAASAAFAQPAQYTSKDIIDTFSRKGDAAQPPAQGQCEAQGMVTGDDGVCEPTKDSRGFSLPTRANLHAAGAPAGSSTAAAAHAMRAAPHAVRVARTAPAAKRDLLITFKTGSSNLTDQAKANAKVFATALNSQALTGSRFDLDGYTDAQGAKGKNQALSQARAASLKDYLVAQGVQGDRLVTHGYGATDFAVPSDPMAAQNRRVVARRID